jgi:D-aminoacyl-tRNA deacylase
MKAVLQRVSQASVTVDGVEVGAIGQGLLVLVCAEPGDTRQTGQQLLHKLTKLRVFGDSAGKMNCSLVDVAGALLLVSQFTLAADLRSGNRPSFSGAAPPELARRLWQELLEDARALHPSVAAGVFGADMKVSLVNDGPVTLLINQPPG